MVPGEDLKIVPDFPTIIGALNQTPILNTYYNFEDHWLKQSMVFNYFLEEISMKNFDDQIIEQLKRQLEFNSPFDSQWIMGISEPVNVSRKDEQLIMTIRVAVMTDDSSAVEGMDIEFSMRPVINQGYYLEDPTYCSGSIKEGLEWLRSHGQLIFEQLEDPFIEKRKRMMERSSSKNKQQASQADKE